MALPSWKIFNDVYDIVGKPFLRFWPFGQNYQHMADTLAVTAGAAGAVTVSKDIVMPGNPPADAVYALGICNPSTETDLTVILENNITYPGGTRNSEVIRLSIPKNTPNGKVFLLRGCPLGNKGRISVNNDQAVSAPFSVDFSVRIP